MALIDAAGGGVIREIRLEGPSGAVYAISPSAGRLAIGQPDGTIRILGLPSLEVAVPPRAGHLGMVVALALTDDGSLLASTGGDRRVALWDPRTLRPLATLPRPDGPLGAVAFDNDGRTLAVGTRDEIVTLWDVPLVRRQLAAHGLDWGDESPGTPLPATPPIAEEESDVRESEVAVPVVRPGKSDPAKLEQARSLFLAGVAASEAGRMAEAIRDLQQAARPAVGVVPGRPRR